MERGAKAAGSGKGGVDKSLITQAVQDEINRLIEEDRGRGWLVWNEEMENLLAECYGKGVSYPGLIKIMNVAFPQWHFTLDRIYRKIEKLGIIKSKRKAKHLYTCKPRKRHPYRPGRRNPGLLEYRHKENKR